MDIKENFGQFKGFLKITEVDKVIWFGSNLIVNSFRPIAVNVLVNPSGASPLSLMQFGIGTTLPDPEDLILESSVGTSRTITKTLFNPPGLPNYNTAINCQYIIPATDVELDTITIYEVGLFNTAQTYMFSRIAIPAGVTKVNTVTLTFDWELYF